MIPKLRAKVEIISTTKDPSDPQASMHAYIHTFALHRSRTVLTWSLAGLFAPSLALKHPHGSTSTWMATARPVNAEPSPPLDAASQHQQT
jgi:hypothetical protein